MRGFAPCLLTSQAASQPVKFRVEGSVAGDGCAGIGSMRCWLSVTLWY